MLNLVSCIIKANIQDQVTTFLIQWNQLNNLVTLKLTILLNMKENTKYVFIHLCRVCITKYQIMMDFLKIKFVYQSMVTTHSNKTLKY